MSRQPKLAPPWLFVVFGDDWGRHVSSMQHLFGHLVDRHTVIWVNGIGHRVPSFSSGDVRRAAAKAVAMVSGRRGHRETPAVQGPRPAEVIAPRVLPWHHRGLVRVFNRRTLLRQIGGALARHAGGRAPILVTGSPPSVVVAGRLGERFGVYYCMDDFSALPSVSGWMLQPLEAELLRRVDATVATAEALTAMRRPASGATMYLPQGVNHAHFETPRPIPEDLAKLPRPIIGFAGGVSDCVDQAIVRALARRFSSGSVVLVGPLTTANWRVRADNVYLLGARPYADLPAYVQAFDVATIPYVHNDWTRSVDPLKLLEYVAAGVPVVTTGLPEVRKYAHLVQVAEGPESFVDAVAAAQGIDRAVLARHRAAVRQHGWAQRAAAFEDWLDQQLVGRVASPSFPAAGIA